MGMKEHIAGLIEVTNLSSPRREYIAALPDPIADRLCAYCGGVPGGGDTCRGCAAPNPVRGHEGHT